MSLRLVERRGFLDPRALSLRYDLAKRPRCVVCRTITTDERAAGTGLCAACQRTSDREVRV
jgi:hypothetical protein